MPNSNPIDWAEASTPTYPPEGKNIRTLSFVPIIPGARVSIRNDDNSLFQLDLNGVHWADFVTDLPAFETAAEGTTIGTDSEEAGNRLEVTRISGGVSVAIINGGASVAAIVVPSADWTTIAAALALTLPDDE